MSKKRVLLGMSGGVDSSVAAILLKQQGYDVIGITMQLLPKEKEHESSCCNLDSITDAKRVCHKLGIPHYTINSRTSFEDHVISPFITSYLNGETPNPCVECNRYIKFEELQKKASEIGADYVATGHYVKRVKNGDGFNLESASDSSKDQSYFLYMLTSDQLKHTLFPLGDYQKSEIRTIAENEGLINAKKSDSQEICFVSKGHYADFIEETSGHSPPPGPIKSLDGTSIGTHKGLHHYTVGQRKGLGISSPTPLYVVKVDPDQNTLWVGAKNDLAKSKLLLSQFSLVNPDSTVIGEEFDIKLRYQMTPVKGKILSLSNSLATLELASPQSQVSRGQSAVLYDKTKVIGGGIITA